MSRWLEDPSGFYVCAQDEEAECGFCCVAMVAHLAEGGDKSFPDTGSMISASKALYKNTGNALYKYDRSTKDRPGMVATPFVPEMELIDYENAQAGSNEPAMIHHGGGTYVELLGTLLRGYGVKCNVFSDDAGGLKSAIQHATPKKPVIVLVLWNPVGQAGGHWVVVAKRHTRGWGASSDYTILDPAGSVETNRGSVEYNPTFYVNSGLFSPYYLTT